MPSVEKTNSFRLTGWHALAIFVGLFVIVGAVNFYMVYMATTTMRGLDRSNAYERGLAYEKDVLASREQAERGWIVDIRVRPIDGVSSHIVMVTALDRDRNPLAGLSASLVLAHPSDAGKDVTVSLSETQLGVFSGSFSADKGSWYTHLTLTQGGEPKFRSRNSVKLD